MLGRVFMNWVQGRQRARWVLWLLMAASGIALFAMTERSFAENPRRTLRRAIQQRRAQSPPSKTPNDDRSVAAKNNNNAADEDNFEASKASNEVPLGTVIELPLEKLPAADGQQTLLNSLAGPQGTLFVFLSTECPLSNGYVPTINQLSRELISSGVAVVALNPNGAQDLRDLAAHRRKYAIDCPVLKDPQGRVAAAVGATICPSVVLLDREGRLIYRGRIDDRYARRGAAAGDIHRDDVREACREFLAGGPVSVPETTALGCPIMAATAPQRAQAANPTTSFARDVAPLLAKHCQECHRPGGIGPFALETYDQAVLWADDLKTFTANRTMPPWMPRSDDQRTDRVPLSHARRLTNEQIATLATWVDEGCPAGDLTQTPPLPTFNDGWPLGTPDLILQPTESYLLGAEGKDEYRCFVIPTGQLQDRYVKTLAVLPGNRQVVHHVIAYLDSTGKAAKLDAADPRPGYATTAGFPGFIPTGSIGGWAPGNNADLLPEGTARRLPRDAVIVMQVHYHRTGKEERDQTQLGLYFAQEPIDRITLSLPILSLAARFAMVIPPGERHYEVTAETTLSKDVLAYAITPHMHLLGKEMIVTAHLPDGQSLTLVDCDWNFNWQESYRFQEPLRLPRGTRLELVAHFDNSDQNPNNPSRPPRPVRWGEQTNDEMCIAFLEIASAEASATPLEEFQLLRRSLQERFQSQIPPVFRERLRQLWSEQRAADGE